jgi:D-alanyl-D-alanine carboxypeptidase
MHTISGQIAVAAPATPVAGPAPLEALPVLSGANTPLHLSTASAIAIDSGTGATLYAQDSTIRRPIASVTKMVTALVILSRHDLTDTITIPTLPNYLPEDEIIGLVPGETYSVQDLLRALLIQSANDSADALAIADAGSIPKFAALMNNKMNEWGIVGTRFVGPSGLIDTGSYATADALSKIARLLLTNTFLRQTVSERSGVITSGSGHTIKLITTNQLLSTGKFYGIKTGYTAGAGECFVGLTRVDGHEVVTVVLGASGRFDTTQSLANWISRNWIWL